MQAQTANTTENSSRAVPRGLTPWQKGQPSPNPSGRPKIPQEVRDIAMALTPDPIRTLGEVMNDKNAPHAARVNAADKILDRALGKPMQSIHMETTQRDALDYSIADLLAIAYSRGAGDADPAAKAKLIEGEPSRVDSSDDVA
jgi:hypothetical protein